MVVEWFTGRPKSFIQIAKEVNGPDDFNKPGGGIATIGKK
jgi:hypothetical protein